MNCFGGASSQENAAQAGESNLAQSLFANYQTTFGEQQDVLSKLKSQISRIQSGETGPGFGGAENAAYISDIQNRGAAAARNTTQAVMDRSAGQVFGGASDSSGLARTSAINKQIAEQATSASELSTANALNEEQAANFRQGRTNAQATVGGLDALAGRYNPESYAQGASSAFGTSFNEASKINEENSSGGLVGGLIASGLKLGGSFLTGGLSNLGDGGWDAGAFFKGGLGALGGKG